MKISSTLQNNLAIFLSTNPKQQSSNPTTRTKDSKPVTKQKFKSLSPFKEKISGHRSTLLRTELKLHKVEVYPNPDYKTLFLAENSNHYTKSSKPDEKLKIIEKLVQTPKDFGEKQGKLTKIILELVVDKVKSKKISNFQQFSEFFYKVLKSAQQEGELSGLIKGEVDEDELLNEIGNKLGVRTMKENSNETKEVIIQDKFMNEIGKNVAERTTKQSFEGTEEVIVQDKLNLGLQENDLNLKPEYKSVEHKKYTEENEEKLLNLSEKESKNSGSEEFLQAVKKSKPKKVKKTEVNQNSSSLIKKNYLNENEDDKNSEGFKKIRPITQANNLIESSEFSFLRNESKDKIIKDEDQAGSNEFYSERDKVSQFLEMKKTSKKNRAKNYTEDILLLPRLKQNLIFEKNQESIKEQNKTYEQEGKILKASKSEKKTKNPQRILEHALNSSKAALKPSKSVESSLHPPKASLRSLKTPTKDLFSQLSRSSSSRMRSPFPTNQLNPYSNSSNLTPWLNRSAAPKSNPSSSQQSSKYSQILTGQTARFSIPSQLKQIHSKTAEKSQKNYEKNLKDLWTQLNSENTQQDLVSNPTLKQKQPRPSNLIQKLRTDPKKIEKKLKNLDSQETLIQSESKKTEDFQKLFESSEPQYQSAPDLLSIPHSSVESRNIPHSNSTQTIRSSIKHLQRPTNTRRSILNSLKKTKSTLIHLPETEKSFEVVPVSKFIHNCGHYLTTLLRSSSMPNPPGLWTSIKSFLLNPTKTPPRSPDIKTTLKSLFKHKEIKPERFQIFWPSPQKSRNFEKRLSAFVFKDNELDEENKKRIKAKEEFLNRLNNERPKSSEKTEILVEDTDFNPYSDTQPSEDLEKLEKKRKFALKIENLIRKRAKSKKKSRHERCKTLGLSS